MDGRARAASSRVASAGFLARVIVSVPRARGGAARIPCPYVSASARPGLSLSFEVRYDEALSGGDQLRRMRDRRTGADDAPASEK
jgi:hypothetical protein